MKKKIFLSGAGGLLGEAFYEVFKKNYELVETYKYIPTERILVETDSPYLSPEPLRGKTNEPKNIIYTTKFLSVVKKVDENSFNKFTTNNFINLFNLNPSI